MSFGIPDRIIYNKRRENGTAVFSGSHTSQAGKNEFVFR